MPHTTKQTRREKKKPPISTLRELLLHIHEGTAMEMIQLRDVEVRSRGTESNIQEEPKGKKHPINPVKHRNEQRSNTFLKPQKYPCFVLGIILPIVCQARAFTPKPSSTENIQ